MGTVLFICPATGLKANGWIADNAEPSASDGYTAVHCPACGKTHFVLPKNGRVMGEKSKPRSD